MVRPPRSTETIEAQREVDRMRELLGSPSVPPQDFEPDDTPTKTDIERVGSFPDKETPTGQLFGLHRYAITFRNEWARVLFLTVFLAFVAYLLASGIVRVEFGR